MVMFLVCGEALMDVFSAGDTPEGISLDARVGGSPFNVAVGLARLECEVGFLGAVSTDFLGERLLRAMRQERVDTSSIHGRLNLFVRSDEQEQAWRWVEPVLQAWREDDAAGLRLRPYAAGSWGPAAASALVARDGFTWAEEQ
jgi:hypothetical protein